MNRLGASYGSAASSTVAEACNRVGNRYPPPCHTPCVAFRGMNRMSVSYLSCYVQRME